MPNKYILAAAVATMLLVLTRPVPAQAYTYNRQSVLTTANGQTINLFDGKFMGGASVTALDLNHDGLDEIIAGTGPGGSPTVEVIDANGQVLMSWLAYDAKFKGGVNVAAGDLDGDGQIEIVTAPQEDTGPLIRIFRNGEVIKQFLAFPSGYHEGLAISVLPYRDGEAGAIIVGSQGLRKDEVRVFSAAGKLTKHWTTNVSRDAQMGISVSAGWSDDWDQPIVVIGAGRTAAPRVIVHGLSTNEDLAAWIAFSSDLRTGVDVDYRDGLIAVAPKGLGQPQVRTFNVAGRFQRQYTFFENQFRGGLNVAILMTASGKTVAAVPTTAKKNQAKIGTKKVVVDLSEQKLTLYQGNKVVSTRRISSGKWSTPTPIGTYKTRNKIPVAYSRPYKLYMEWWMAFTADGKYGLHSLPYWRTRNGKLYEGAAHIGTPVSHGCIRQTVVEAKSLYDWAPVGTPVIVQK